MNERTPAQLKALAAARQKRAIAVERMPPEGYRSVEHFLDEVREYCHRNMRLGGSGPSGSYSPVTELADYLHVNPRTVHKWINRDKIPMQPTIDIIARWMLSRRRS